MEVVTSFESSCRYLKI